MLKSRWSSICRAGVPFRVAIIALDLQRAGSATAITKVRRIITETANAAGTPDFLAVVMEFCVSFSVLSYVATCVVT